MARLVAALDQGTTSTRAILFDRAGGIVSADQQEHAQSFPQPGWVEHDPREIWERSRAVLANALAAADATWSEVAAIGVANQRETTVVWNRFTGEPYAPAIVWNDTRTAALCRAIAGRDGDDRFRPQTGLPIATYFSGPKLRWLLDHTPGLRAAAEAGDALFGTIDTWLIWNLTGGPSGGLHVTDVTNASRTLLFNLRTLDWDDAILRALAIPRAMLPRVAPSVGRIADASVAAPGVPIAGVFGDQQAALFGQTCFAPGDAKNTYGTGCFLLLNTGTTPVVSAHGLLTTIGYQIGDSAPVYCLEGAIATTGSLIQWLRDNLGLIESAAAVEPLAASVPDSGGMYIAPAFSGLFAPYWRSDARGVFVGLTAFITKAHIARAALEATAFQTRDVVDAMAQDAGTPLQTLKVDGGMTANGLLMQFQADILNVPVVRPAVIETTALGAAYGAGLAVGFWNSLDDLRANWREDARWRPTMTEPERAARCAGWQKAIARTLNWVEAAASD